MSKQVTIVSASVKHSQRLSDTPLKPWVAAEMTGKVIRAHCTCTAQVARKLFRKDVKDSSSDQYVGNLMCDLCECCSNYTGDWIAFCTRMFDGTDGIDICKELLF